MKSTSLRIFCVLLIGASWLVVPAHLRGQATDAEKKPDSAGAVTPTTVAAPRFQVSRPEDNANLRIYRLTVSPAGEADPALQHVLWPDFRRRTSGESVPYYYRAILEYLSAVREGQSAWNKEFGENYESNWQELPLDRFSIEQVKLYARHHRNMFEELKAAAYCEQCHWDLSVRELKGLDAVLFTIPDVQFVRSMGYVLALRARLQILEGDFEGAIETLRVGYKLAHDIAMPQTLIHDLIGTGIADSLSDVLTELMTAREAPNLYWAIAGIPRPLIDMRSALDLEMSSPLRVLPFLEDAESVDRSPEEWRRLLLNVFEEVDRYLGPRQEVEINVTAMILKGYPRAKRELIEWGFAPDKVESMAVCQVIAIRESRILRHITHEMFKWSLLPPHEGLPGLQASMTALREEGYLLGMGRSREIIPVGYKLLSSIESGMFASARVERELAALRTIEALRMHAAQTGRLPDSLSDVKLVPIPGDPITGKPFEYRLEGQTAILQLPAVSPGAFHGSRYEITLESAR